MKSPVFAYGSLDSLERALERGKVNYPTYCWLYDTLQYAFINKEKEIELVGLPKLTGTLDDEIILANLNDGIYQIAGQYKVTETSETVFLSASYIFVIIATIDDTKKIKRITVDNVEDYDVVGGEVTSFVYYVTSEYLEEHEYITEPDVDIKIAAMAVTLEQEIKDYVDSIISEQIAELLPEELDKILQPEDEGDIRDLFGE